MGISTGEDIVNRVGGALILRMDERGIGDVNGDLVTFHPSYIWQLLAGSVDSYIWTNGFTAAVYRLFAARVNTTVAGGAGANLQIVHCAQGGAIASGTPQLTGVIDLTVAAPGKLSGVLIASPTDILPGDSLAVDFNGTLSPLVGVLTFFLRKVR
jgi:hypothetical protein